MTTVDLQARDVQVEIDNGALIAMVSEQGNDKTGCDGGMLHDILTTVAL